MQQKLAAAVAAEVAARLAEVKEQLQQQVTQQLQQTAAASKDNALDSKIQDMMAASKRDITSNLEKKMHAALDAALQTLRAETRQGGGAKAAAEVGALRTEFEEMRGAIKRNALWLLQAPT